MGSAEILNSYVDISGPAPVHRLLQAAAARRPGGEAVRDPEGSWTYTELAAEASRFAQWLTARGLRRGDRIAVDAVPDRRFAAMLYGSLMAGGAFVPLSQELTAPERAYLLDDAEPAVTITAAGSGAPGETAAAVWDELPRDGAEVAVGPSDLALLIYTSGSTSRPKAVMCPHANVRFATRAIGARLAYRPDDVVFTRLPLSFDYGLYQLLLCADATAAVVLPRPGDDARLWAAVAESGATVVPVVPALADMLTRLARRRPLPNAVRLFTNTGERLDPTRIAALREHFPNAAVQLMYGLTECKRVTVGAPDGDRDRPGSVGRALDGTAVRVVDAAGVPLPPLSAGEITVSGPHVMAGYWRAPELTARVFRTGPGGEAVLHTGDWGHLDDSGELHVHGRRDDQFKSRGVRTGAAEIEEAANAVPGVRDAVLLPPRDGREAVLFVSADLAPEAVLGLLRVSLEAAKVPRECRVVDSMPLGRNGKIDKAALAELVRG